MGTPARAAALLFAIAAALCFSLPLAEAEPQPAPRLSSIDIPFETFTLKNGLRVIVHTDRKTPVVAVGVWYGVGSRDEKSGRTGFAHLFEHLMFNGSENHNDEWFKPFERVGATDQNGTTSFDRTNYFQTVPKTALAMTLWLESDRMGHLLGAIDQAKLDEQRGVVQNEKRQGDNQPYGLVFYNLFSGLFPSGHPYSWSTIGSMEDLNAASLEDVKEWFRAYYGAANAVLVLGGDVDLAEARPLVEKYFNEVDPGPPVGRREVAVPRRATNTRDVLKDRVPQARIYRAWIGPTSTTRDAAELSLAGAVLAQGKTSKLYKALVYDQKVATDVSGGLFSLEIAGAFIVQVTLASGQDVADVSRRLDAAMADFLKAGPSTTDLDRVRSRYYAGIVRGLERVGGFSGKIVRLAEGALYAEDPGFFRRTFAWQDAATAASVRAVANEWLARPWHQVEVVPFGDLAASTSGTDRSKLPSVDSTAALTFPAIEQGTLPNGAKIVLARRTGIPLVEINALFEGGYTADAGRKLGLTSFTMGMLDEGTPTRTALQIAAEAEELGASLSIGAGIEVSAVRLSALKAKLASSLTLMADVIRNPSFEPKEIDRVRKIWLAGITQEKAQPETLAFRLLPPALYGPGSKYGVPLTGSGTEESIGALTREDLIATHAARIRPDNATFFVVGDITMAEATAALGQAFQNWKPPTMPLAATAADTPPLTGPRLILIDRPKAVQSVIIVGRATTPAAAPTALAQEVMNTTFGGQFTSRINMNLREEKHWSYGAGSFFANTRGKRPWGVFASVQTDKTLESLAEIRRELSDYVGARPMTEDEFTAAVARNTRSLPGRFETLSAVLSALTSPAADGRPLDWTPTLPQRYAALKLDDARAAAKEVIDPAKMTWIVVGDRTKIEKGLRATGIAPLEIWDDNGNPVAAATTAAR